MCLRISETVNKSLRIARDYCNCISLPFMQKSTIGPSPELVQSIWHYFFILFLFHFKVSDLCLIWSHWILLCGGLACHFVSFIIHFFLIFFLNWKYDFVIFLVLLPYLLYALFPGVGDGDSGPGLKLPPLKLQNGKGLVVRISGGNGLLRNRRLEVENGACGSSFGPLTKVRVFSDGCSSGDVPQWEAVLGHPVCGSVANGQLVVIACEDATLHLLHTDTGMVCHLCIFCIVMLIFFATLFSIW